MNDMQAVREAAERVCDGDYVYEPRAVLFHFSRLRMNDVCALADAYLSLTDPTPLTVERLVEAGFVQRPASAYFACGIIEVMPDDKCESDEWYWFIGHGVVDGRIRPRTVGHLRQLLLRMEKQ